MVVPYRLTKYSVKGLFKFVCEFVDTFVVAILSKFGMTKGEAKVKAKKMAKKQIGWLRSFIIYFIIFVTIFSVSFFFSASLYTGAYLYLIPRHTQEIPMYYKFKNLDDTQKQVFKNEAFLGQGISALMQKIPSSKFISTISVKNKLFYEKSQ